MRGKNELNGSTKKKPRKIKSAKFRHERNRAEKLKFKAINDKLRNSPGTKSLEFLKPLRQFRLIPWKQTVWKNVNERRRVPNVWNGSNAFEPKFNLQ